MKPVVISMPLAAVNVDGGLWLKQDGAGAVTINDGAATAIGIGMSRADNSTTPDPKFKRSTIGCIKQGIVTVIADTATYNVGDALELKADGQTMQALAAGTLYATAVETKVLAAPGSLKVYVDLI